MFLVLSILLLLAFNVDWIPGRPWNHHYVLIWTSGFFHLLKIMPQEAYVLVDGKALYRYMDTVHNEETYIPAIHLGQGVRQKIFHYQHLEKWHLDHPPIVQPYPKKLKTEVEILNYVSSNLAKLDS